MLTECSRNIFVDLFVGRRRLHPFCKIMHRIQQLSTTCTNANKQQWTIVDNRDKTKQRAVVDSAMLRAAMSPIVPTSVESLAKMLIDGIIHHRQGELTHSSFICFQ